MIRRRFLQQCSLAGASLVSFVLSGCRGKQYAHILESDDRNMVGSHEAGASVFEPLVQKAVVDLLARESSGSIQQAGHNEQATFPKKICFCGIENASAEELGDFKEQLYEIIDQQIVEAQVYEPVSRRFVEAGLREGRLRPDELFLPNNQRTFVAIMEKQGNPFDYLLFAKLTSGTTRSNGSDYQRDYLLTLELVNIPHGRRSEDF